MNDHAGKEISMEHMKTYGPVYGYLAALVYALAYVM